MKYIIISGIDGSGKTTIINKLEERLKSEGFRTRYVWMRYNHYLVKGLNGLARLLYLSVKKQYGERIVWEHHYYRSKLFYPVYIFCSFIDNKIAARKVTRLSAAKYDIVLCDRWVNDIIADIGSEFRRKNIFSTKWYRRFQNILPENSVQFVITRPDEFLLDAREENRYDANFNYRLEIYKSMSAEGSAIQVDNSGTVDRSVEFIMKKI